MAEAANTGFDFSALSVETAELPPRAGGREKKFRDNPFTTVLRESFDTKTGRKVEVPKAQLKDLEYLLRSAATELGIGVRIVKSLTGEALEKAANNKKITVQFQGQKKKQYTKRNAEETPAPETAS